MHTEQIFSKIRSLLAHSGYKIFTPSWKYCRLKPALIAVRATPGKESAYLIKVHRGKILVGWLQPDRGDKAVDRELNEKFGSLLKRKPRLLYPFRLDNWDDLHRLITPTERDEFRTLIYNTRLS